MTKKEFLAEVGRYRKQHPAQRYGQAVFNVMAELLPAEADEHRSTGVDPFYINERADAFIEACGVRG